MSQIGGPIPSALAGIVPSQETVGQTAAKREREKAEATRRAEDAVDLKVAGLDESEAIEATEEHNPNQSKNGKGRGQRHGQDSEDDSETTGDDDESNPPPQMHIDVTG